MSEKIFCLGLARTGTLSLAKALGVLGYRAVHDYKISERIAFKVACGESLNDIDELKCADAFLDWPHPIGILEAVARGDHKIIYTYPLDTETWINSCLIHVLHSRCFLDSPWHDIDTEGMRAEKRALELAVLSLLDRHPERVLVFNATHGWAPICAFLGKDIPRGAAFPKENGSAERLEKLAVLYRSR